jgi:hypothetical protein
MPVIDLNGSEKDSPLIDQYAILLLDDPIQVNAHFNCEGNIDLLAIKIHNDYLVCNANEQKAELNESPIYNYVSLTNGFAEYRYTPDPKVTKLPASLLPFYVNHLLVDIDNYYFHIILNKVGETHFYNFVVTAKNKELKPKGLCGKEPAYKIRDLWDTKQKVKI